MRTCIRATKTTAAVRSGVATTELAISLPVLLLLLVGAVDYGRVGHAACALANAVGAGSHFAATNMVSERNESDWNDTIELCIETEMATVPGFDAELLTTSITRTQIAQDDVIVDLEATYPFTPLIDWPGLPGEFQLRKTVTIIQYQ